MAHITKQQLILNHVNHILEEINKKSINTDVVKTHLHIIALTVQTTFNRKQKTK